MDVSGFAFIPCIYFGSDFFIRWLDCCTCGEKGVFPGVRGGRLRGSALVVAAFMLYVLVNDSLLVVHVKM